MSRTNAVVFDLDGTLVDTMALGPAVYADVIGRLGGPFVTAEQIVHVWHLGPTRALLEHFLERPINDEDLQYYFDAFGRALENVDTFDGVTELMDALKRTGTQVGIFTSATRRAAKMMLASAGLTNRVGVVVAGDEAPRPKPAPDGLQLVCGLLGVRCDEAAYVGDADIDMECAAAAGTRAVVAGWGAIKAGRCVGAPVATRPMDVVRLLELERSRDRDGP